MTQEEYADLLELQNGVCSICQSPPQNKRLCIDHNHETGEIRSLLCNYCNTALHVVENELFMQQLLDYLERF